jgi:hypothetical protein
MSLKTEFRGLEAAQAHIKRVSDRLRPSLRAVDSKARKLLVQALADYPPVPAGSRYIRTERLKRGWERATPAGTAFGFQLINSTEYAQFVQGQFQAKAHRGRWESAESILHRLEEELFAIYEDAAQEALA